MRWAILLVAIALWASPQPVCANRYCPPIVCASSAMCGYGCICLIPGGEVLGECYGVGR